MTNRKAKINLNGPSLKESVKYKTRIYNFRIELLLLDHCGGSNIEAPEVPTAAYLRQTAIFYVHPSVIKV